MRTRKQTRGETGGGRTLDLTLAGLAGEQHGVVAREQLLELGWDSGAIGRRVRGGRLHRLHFGVYAVGHRVVSRHGRWMAAVLACGDRAALSHRSAAALWGIRRPSSRAIEVTCPAKSRSNGGIQRHFAVLPADEVTAHDGIPVTTVPRTILDLAAVERPEAVESALRQAEYLRLHDRLSLPDLLARHPRRAGTRAVRLALARVGESSGQVESPLEERFLRFLDRHRLPRPQLNAWLEAGGRRYRVDCLWRDEREVVELDGWEAHGTRSAFRDDRSRDRRLHAENYRVTHLTWSQLEDEPEEIAADLRRGLGAESHHRSRT